MSANSWEGGSGLAVPDISGSVSGQGGDTGGESPDAMMARLVDAVVDQLEDRVIEELERRGRRQSWTAF